MGKQILHLLGHRWFYSAEVSGLINVHVENCGIEHIEKKDVGMVFFVEVKNEGKQPMALSVRMIRCCETICTEDIDCEHIQLIGGDMGVLNPRAVRNLTLIWPTLYLHDRTGECDVGISYTCKNNHTGELHQKVHFDTSVSKRHVPAVLEGYYSPHSVKTCSTVDLDSLDSCRPVNCHIKYNGKRNFFNRKSMRCQPVPICIADSSKELPDVAYVPASNTCRDLENAVDEVEVRALSRGNAEPAWSSETAPHIANMHCHHGYADNVTGFCLCDEGWTSLPLGNIEPSTEFINMCNIQTIRFPRLRQQPIRLLLVIIAGLMGLLVVLFCCAMALVMHELMPPGATTECAQQTGGLSYFDSSTKTFTSHCSSGSRRFTGNRSSSICCPGRR
ncbi:uncharacterized protein LOC105698350 [Orussus abietinus]|uniref:uncharacterized protein LOC105698350 n=1 Tax=Orussus abietinus TaxID=222816 RepID=UPI000C715C64|nr:uncharacterized protein LOC105698350 [Orussus abietinus]